MVAACSLVPAILTIIYISSNAVNVPWNDEVTQIDVAIRSLRGTLTLADMFAQHNEHRIFFTNLVTIILARLTQWDVRYGIYVSFFLAVVCFALLINLFQRD